MLLNYGYSCLAQVKDILSYSHIAVAFYNYKEQVIKWGIMQLHRAPFKIIKTA